MDKAKFDYETTMLIAAHAATGLGVDPAMGYDSPAIVAAAATVFGNEEEIAVLGGHDGYMLGIQLGMRIALAKTAEPLDPRERMLAAFKAEQSELTKCAELARQDIRVNERSASLRAAEALLAGPEHLGHVSPS